jgi:hypothetical protein
MLALIFLIAAFLCALGAAFNVPVPPSGRPQLGWLALAFYFASLLAGNWKV